MSPETSDALMVVLALGMLAAGARQAARTLTDPTLAPTTTTVAVAAAGMAVLLAVDGRPVLAAGAAAVTAVVTAAAAAWAWTHPGQEVER